MSAESSTPAIATRSRGPVPRIGDAASTPLPTQADDRRQDGQFVMLETLEQLEELFSRSLAAKLRVFIKPKKVAIFNIERVVETIDTHPIIPLGSIM